MSFAQTIVRQAVNIKNRLYFICHRQEKLCDLQLNCHARSVREEIAFGIMLQGVNISGLSRDSGISYSDSSEFL